jgi:tRNA-guanine family transglycosylase
VCQKYTRAYLHTVAAKEEVGGQLLSYHNIAYQMRCVSFIVVGDDHHHSSGLIRW